jgi:hypothetical protein
VLSNGVGISRTKLKGGEGLPAENSYRKIFPAVRVRVKAEQIFELRTLLCELGFCSVRFVEWLKFEQRT